MAATVLEKALCVLELAKRHFRRRYGKPPTTRQSIYDWSKKFQETGCLCKGKSSGRPSVSEEKVERFRETFTRSPRKSTTRASLELQMPRQTVWTILRKRLRTIPYELQLVQALSCDDKRVRYSFCMSMQQWNEEDDDFFNRLIFGDESTFNLSGKVNKHNVRIWGTENPRELVQYVRDSPKVNVFCAVSRRKVYGPFFPHENTVTGITYLDMFSEWLLPQMQQDSENFIFIQDGAPPHWHSGVRH